MSADGFMYEGRDVTANTLAKEFVWSRGRIQSALESGAQTRDAVVAYCTAADMRARTAVVAGGRKSARQIGRVLEPRTQG
jgi:hypothetical protein